MMDGSDVNADRLAVIAPSMILGLMAQALELKALGHPVIDLGIGEPDFKTPDRSHLLPESKNDAMVHLG